MKKTLEILCFAFFILFCIFLCAIDSESMIPFVMALVSLMGIVICNLFLHKKEVSHD